MTRLYDNSKVKKVVAWLLLVSIVMSTFIASTTDSAYADSNSRRITSINLASGAGFGDITDANSIDETSMQTIAVYLTNFYLPFVTILDGDYTEEGAKDSGNNQHVRAMKDALIRNCGFDKDVVDYIISYVLDQSLSSCKSLYMKRSDLDDCFNKTNYGGGDHSFLGFSNGGGFSASEATGYSSNWDSSLIRYTREIKSSSFWTGTSYGDWEYYKSVSTVSAPYYEYGTRRDDPVEFVPVSYAIFLGVMMNQYRVYDPSSGTYVIKSLGTKRFYNLGTDQNGLVMNPVFDNTAVCSKALLNALQYCDVENGYSTAFASISGVDIEAIHNPEASQYALVTCPNVYVNWEGSLVFDNGVYRTIILPGCQNPYMVNTMIGTHSLNYVTNNATSSLSMGLISSTDQLSLGGIAFGNYRVTLGSDQENFDQSWKPGDWGSNQTIHDLIESVQYVDVVGSWGQDFARFPILTTQYSNISDVDGQPRFKRMSSSGNTKITDIVWTDVGFSPVKAGDQLSSFFHTSPVDSLVSELKLLDIDTYAQFKNIKGQGHSLSYPRSSQKLFQNIYLTYCFAAFNSEVADGTSFNADQHIVNMRFNFDIFPKANGEIEWKTVINDNNQLAEAIMSFIYYLLHPTQGIGYVTTLFKNKVSGILLGWHEDIVGGTSSNSATGMTKYLGTSSYTTMPNLKDISWVSGLLNIYNNIVVYLIILMCLILLCYVLTGSMTIQRGIVGVVLFGICAFLPPIAINAAVDAINTTSDTIFSQKFDFWAICQLQTFLDSYEDAMEANSEGNFTSYAAFVLSNTKSDLSLADDDSSASEPSFSGAKVKWMAPKKYNSLASLVAAVNENTSMGNSSASFLKNSLLTMVSKSSSGETYLDDSESLYLYRDYADIFKFAHASYNIWGTFNYQGKLGVSNDSRWTQDKYPLGVFINSAAGGSSYNKAWNGITAGNALWQSFVEPAISTRLNTTVSSETSSVYHISRGYMYNTIGYDYNTVPSSATSFSYLYTNATPDRNTLAVSYLANYTQTYREVNDGYSRLLNIVNAVPGYHIQAGTPSSGQYYNFGLPKASSEDMDKNGSYMWGYPEILGLKDSELPVTDTNASVSEPGIKRVYKNLSDVFYGLYSESPFYYFNANIRDQANATDLNGGENYEYDFDDLSRGKLGTSAAAASGGSFGDMNHIARMFLQNNQEYFFNLTLNAGDGYGELRDFTNMHDFFYFVIPYMRSGVELARVYDDVFGLYVDDDCSLVVNADGSILYDGTRYETIDEFGNKLTTDPELMNKYTEEELYKLWHTYNTYTILSAYSPWIDTMLDCDYAKSETIHVMGDSFRVSDPLNPRTYYQTDASGNITGGRYMVFSRSEMNDMGLTTDDLTTVERKIIQFQDNVYNKTLNLMNYYTFSDEVMIQAYAMLQTFEFNKLFSQTSLVKTSYVMYPQGYELKAFSYDAYLRMIVSGASGESLMYNGASEGGNVSIYERVMKNTSLFFGIFLLLNDLLAVYVIPGLKIFFLVTIFVCSVLILIGSVIKMEMNILTVLWKSLFAPLLSFSAICIGMSIIVSMFMKTGANGVVQSEFTISVGDPTSAIILMIILNVLVVILMWKICKKCFRDLITYGKAVFDNIGGTVVGAVGAVGAGFAAGRAMDRFGSGSSGGSGVSHTAKQRGRDNDPRSGRTGVGSALAAGVGGAAIGAAAAGGSGDSSNGLNYGAMSAKEKQQLRERQQRDESVAGMNKYDKKAYSGATAKQDVARDKAARDAELAANATGLRKKRYELAQKVHTRQAENAAIKADNVKKYGTGARGQIENMKSAVGKGRQTRLQQIGGTNAAMGAYHTASIGKSKAKGEALKQERLNKKSERKANGGIFRGRSGAGKKGTEKPRKPVTPKQTKRTASKPKGK